MATNNNEFTLNEIEENQREYTQYAQEVEQTLTALEAGLHNTDDPDEIMMGMLRTATAFYDGDRAGIMEADLTMKVWSPLLWYNRKKNGMTPNPFDELEEGEYLVRWIDALTNGTAIIIHDIEEIKDTAPQEYEFMVKNQVKTLLAVPFWKRPTGFLIVRNPKRYLGRSSLLKMMAFVAVSSINEKRLQDSLKMKSIPDSIQSDIDVVINLFGELQVITNRGMITEKNLNSTMLSSFVAYMVLHQNRRVSAAEITHDLRPNDLLATPSKNIKNLVYRLHQSFFVISDHKLVESSVGTYRLNSELNIKTDLQLFEEYWSQAQITADLQTKVSILKKAVELYKHGLAADYYDIPWFVSSKAHYTMRYAGIISLLLSTLDKLGDYRCIHEYANNALKILPGSQDVYYWLIYSIMRLGSKEIAQAEIIAAKGNLTEDDYNDLCNRLTERGINL